MTLDQVAVRARVSRATVSRVLNNRAHVRNSVRTRVMQAMEELKYRPNLCLFGPEALPEHEFVIDPELVLRDSTGPPPRS